MRFTSVAGEEKIGACFQSSSSDHVSVTSYLRKILFRSDEGGKKLISEKRPVSSLLMYYNIDRMENVAMCNCFPIGARNGRIGQRGQRCLIVIPVAELPT